MQAIVSRKGRPNPLARYAVVIGLAAAAGGLAGGISALLGDVKGPLGVLATVAIVCLAMLVGLAACIWWWRRADEAVREAHKWAWWWGGTAGMAVGGVILLTIVTRGGDTPAVLVGMEPSHILYAGAGGILLCQILGYSIAWAFWWLQRR